MKLLLNFETAVIAVICLLSCEKPQENVNRSGQGEITISAEVPNKIYTNNRNIKLDASNTDQINGNGHLFYSWICKEFPVGQAPKINNASKAIATIDSIKAGNYNFQLTVMDNFGQQAISNYAMEVLQDTLTGSPKIVPAADLTLKLPTSLIIVDASLSVLANPPNRKLVFQWSILQKPVENNEPIITTNSNSFTYITNLERGQYQVLLKITNEIGLSSYDTVGINVLEPTLITKVFEITWEDAYDDFTTVLYAKITDPGNFVGRNKQNTSLSVLNLENQELLDDKKYNWVVFDNALHLYYYHDLTLIGKKAKVTISYYE